MNFLSKSLMVDANSLELMSNLQRIGPREIRETYTIVDGTAVISIHGLLTKRDDEFSFGTTSYDSIFEQVTEAIKDVEVQEIALDIDSPGGEVSGLFDLVDFIYNARNQKPIYAYVNDCACSAAYAIASAASKIFVTRTSMVGSIGVIAIHSDISEAEKKAGIKYTTVFAGAKKSALSPHESITNEAISDLQNEVDRIYQIFVETVARNRRIPEKVVKNTEAGVFYGENGIDISYQIPMNVLKENAL